MKKSYESKIKMFTALAGSASAFMANNAQSQSVVRDINPDVVVSSSNASYNIDIDNDGTTDFTLRKFTYTYNGTIVSSVFYTIGYSGSNRSVTFSNQNGYNWYDDRLDLGDSSTVSSLHHNSQYTDLFGWNLSYGLAPSDARWVAGTTDKYLGVQFLIGSNLHYGWIKMSVAADYSTVTVKEVGYEKTPGALSKMGSTVTADSVSSVNAWDQANNANGLDIGVSFNKAPDETNISKYRAYVVPTAAISSGTLATFQTLASTRYVDIAKTGSNIVTSLTASLLDIQGNAIVNGTPYTVFIESVGNTTTADMVPAGSASFTLSATVIADAATSVSGSDVANNSTAADIRVTFNKASNEANIASYRVYVVPTASVSSVTLPALQALASSRYETVAKTGSNLFVNGLTSGLLDSQGNAIALNTAYTIFVVSIGSGANDGISGGSPSFMLTNSVTGLFGPNTTVVKKIYSASNTVYFLDMESNGSVKVMNLLGAEVYSGSISSGNSNIPLQNIVDGIYIVEVNVNGKIYSQKVSIQN